KQLENAHFIFKLSQLLQNLQLKPHELILEISEVTLISHWKSIEKSLHMLKQLGIQLGISEFGTGKIALNSLRGFPIHYLKMAPALVNDIVHNPETAAIVKMIVSLGNTLGLRVIAEGVETEPQKLILIDAGCLLMQGNLFGSPLLPQECA